MRRTILLGAVIVLSMFGSTPIQAHHGSSHLMTVVVEGTGTGTVTSTPGGIACPPDCTEWYPASVTRVELLATPDLGSAFATWAGSVCDNKAPVYPNPCNVPMKNKRTITATFEGGGSPPPSPSPPPPPPGDSVRIVATRDICGHLVRCTETGRQVRDGVRDGGVELVLMPGDVDQANGLFDEYTAKWHPRWGLDGVFERALPAVGNHDCYDTPRGAETTPKEGCAGTIAFFGTDATVVDRVTAQTPFTATDLTGLDVPPFTYVAEAGDWLIVVLNSAGDVGTGMATQQERDAQTQVLQDVLAADTTHRCEIVVWHHPRYASGDHGSNVFFDAWGDVAYANGVELVFSGHAHSYERFDKQDGDGQAAADGFRQFVLGTGGAGLDKSFNVQPNSQVRISDHGVTFFELGDGGYSWEFRDHRTNAIEDSGSDTCSV